MAKVAWVPDEISPYIKRRTLPDGTRQWAVDGCGDDLFFTLPPGGPVYMQRNGYGLSAMLTAWAIADLQRVLYEVFAALDKHGVIRRDPVAGDWLEYDGDVPFVLAESAADDR